MTRTGPSAGPGRSAGVEAPGDADAADGVGDAERLAPSGDGRGRGGDRSTGRDPARGRDGTQQGGGRARGRGRRRKAAKSEASKNSPFEIVLIVAVALGLALGIQAFLVKPYRIPSESMVPTLVIDQRVLVNRLGNRFGDPNVGDVTVFHPPTGAETKECGVTAEDDMPCPTPTRTKAEVNFIKRVVAGPGDTLAIVDGHVIRNGKRQREPFIRPCSGGGECTFSTPITIPPDHYFMMGDNRGASDDSRFWGPVPREWIIGNAFATYWPPKRIGPL